MANISVQWISQTIVTSALTLSSPGATGTGLARAMAITAHEHRAGAPLVAAFADGKDGPQAHARPPWHRSAALARASATASARACASSGAGSWMEKLMPFIWLAPAADQRIQRRAQLADILQPHLHFVVDLIAGEARRLVVVAIGHIAARPRNSRSGYPCRRRPVFSAPRRPPACGVVGGQRRGGGGRLAGDPG